MARDRRPADPAGAQSHPRQPPQDGSDTALSAIGELLCGLSDTELRELAERLRPFIDQARGEELLTPVVAAGLLHVHPKTLTRGAAAGRVPGAQRVGKAWRFRADVLALEPPAGPRPSAPMPTLTRRHGNGGSVADAIRSGGVA
jgi:hypothetical protein